MSGLKAARKLSATDNLLVCPQHMEAKWDCMFNYFEEMMQTEKLGTHIPRKLQFVRHNLSIVKKIEQENQIIDQNFDPWSMDFRNWKYWTENCSNLLFANLEIHLDGTIEDFFPYGNAGKLQFEQDLKNESEILIKQERCVPYHADFANKYVGGGVLGSGCVQEEIRYLINSGLSVFLSQFLKNYLKIFQNFDIL